MCSIQGGVRQLPLKLVLRVKVGALASQGKRDVHLVPADRKRSSEGKSRHEKAGHVSPGGECEADQRCHRNTSKGKKGLRA